MINFGNHNIKKKIFGQIAFFSEERIASVKLTTAVDSKIWLFKHSYLYRHISAVAICVLFALNSIFSLERERPITKKFEKVSINGVSENSRQ